MKRHVAEQAQVHLNPRGFDFWRLVIKRETGDRRCRYSLLSHTRLTRVSVHACAPLPRPVPVDELFARVRGHSLFPFGRTSAGSFAHGRERPGTRFTPNMCAPQVNHHPQLSGAQKARVASCRIPGHGSTQVTLFWHCMVAGLDGARASLAGVPRSRRPAPTTQQYCSEFFAICCLAPVAHFRLVHLREPPPSAWLRR